MRLTTKGRYAVTAMLDLALHAPGGSCGANTEAIAVATISARHNISLAYLQQLLTRLRVAGLVLASKGPGGGYRLAKPADQISVSAVICAVGEGIDATRCGGSGDCQAGHQCLTHGLWVDLSEQIDDFLDGISLGALVASNRIEALSIPETTDPARVAARNLR
jgi:Rrf2 family iron-sulfur cluster assembly transcriptional regulator